MSIRELIETNIAKPERFLINDQRNLWFRADEELMQFRCIYGHVGYGLHKRLHGPNFSFTFLRDPLDRVLSLYDFWRQLDVHNNEPFILRAKEQDIEQFFVQDCPSVYSEIDNAMTWMLFCDKGLDVRGYYASLSKDELLERATENLFAMSFIGFLHQFDDDVYRLCDQLQWKVPQGDKHHNKTPKRTKASDLASKLRKQLEAALGLDYRLYEAALTQCKI